MPDSNVVDCAVEPRPVKPNTIELIHLSEHTILWSKSKDWLTRNRNNVSEWSNTSTHVDRLLFQWAYITTIQLSVLAMVCYKADIIIIRSSNVTCSCNCHDIAENYSFGVKQQSLAHLLFLQQYYFSSIDPCQFWHVHPFLPKVKDLLFVNLFILWIYIVLCSWNSLCLFYQQSFNQSINQSIKGRRSCDCMVDGFTTTCPISITYLSPLTLWVKIPLMPKCTRYNIMW